MKEKSFICKKILQNTLKNCAYKVYYYLTSSIIITSKVRYSVNLGMKYKIGKI